MPLAYLANDNVECSVWEGCEAAQPFPDDAHQLNSRVLPQLQKAAREQKTYLSQL